MKTTENKVNNEATVTVNKSKKATPKRVATVRNTKEDITPKAKRELDTKNLKDTVKTAVISQREVKWKYPEDINGPIDRKKWRGQQRDKLTKLTAAVTLAGDDKTKKTAERTLTQFRKEVLLVP